MQSEQGNMTSMIMVRAYKTTDQAQVIDLWIRCGLVVPHNHPLRDIERKLNVNPEWFLIAEAENTIIGTCMVGYEGHRGWINYLAVAPNHRRRGVGRTLMQHTERQLKAVGCPKINLQIRETNTGVIQFYQRIGYTKDPVVSMGKRLEPDQAYPTVPRDDSNSSDEAQS